MSPNKTHRRSLEFEAWSLFASGLTLAPRQQVGVVLGFLVGVPLAVERIWSLLPRLD